MDPARDLERSGLLRGEDFTDPLPAWRELYVDSQVLDGKAVDGVFAGDLKLHGLTHLEDDLFGGKFEDGEVHLDQLGGGLWRCDLC